MRLGIPVLNAKIPEMLRQHTQEISQRFRFLVEVNKNKATPGIYFDLPQAVAIRGCMREVPGFRQIN